MAHKGFFAGILVILIISILIGAFWDYTQDDVFITYTYSRNIADGVGFVFNAGEQVQGTTTPLWAITMAGGYWLTHDLLHLGNLLGGIFIALTCLIAYHLTRAYLSFYARVSLMLLIATSPLIYASLGMETLFYCALLTVTFWCWAQDKRSLAFIGAIAVTWTRADGAVIGGTLGILMLYDWYRGQQPFRQVVKLGTLYALGTAVWFIFAYAYFGSFTPNTLRAKQAILEGTAFLSDGIDRWDSFYGNNPLSLLGVALIPIGMWVTWRKPKLRAIPLWFTLYLAGYTVLNITNFWYYTPLLLVGLILATFGGEQLVRWIMHLPVPRQAVITGSLLIAVISVGFGIQRSLQIAPVPERMRTYREVGEWMSMHTPPETTMFVADLGVVGFYADRYTLDSFGLIVPEMHIRNRVDYGILKYRLDTIIATSYFIFDDVRQAQWFNEMYMPLTQISTEDDLEFSPMTVYQRRYPLTPPQTIVQGFTLPLTCSIERESGVSMPTHITARLLNNDNDPVLEAEQPIFGGIYPDSVALGEEHITEQILIAVDLPPDNYQWELICDETYTGEVEVIAFAESDSFIDINAQWGDFVRLDGVILPHGDTTWSGGIVSIVTRFTPIGLADTNYNIFLQLLDENGMLVAQSDGQPANSRLSADTWMDIPFLDQREIAIPPTLPDGDYTLVIGWYDWRTGERVLNSNNEDSLILPLTIHNRFPRGSGLP